MFNLNNPLDDYIKLQKFEDSRIKNEYIEKQNEIIDFVNKLEKEHTILVMEIKELTERYNELLKFLKIEFNCEKS